MESSLKLCLSGFCSFPASMTMVVIIVGVIVGSGDNSSGGEENDRRDM